MAQKSWPISEVSNLGWTPTPVHQPINELVANDTSLVSSSGNQGDSFVVGLRGLAWPAPGTRKLTVRLKKTDAGNLPVYVTLLQGNTPVAAGVYQPTLSLLDYVMTLTQDEAALISDYNALRVRVTAGNSVSVDCCSEKLPEVLQATLSNKIGDPGWLNLPNSFYLVWDGARWVAQPHWQYCSVHMGCVGGAPYFGVPANSGWTCAPFNAVFDLNQTICSGLGTGSARITMTE
jgi:hypothetical protein